MPTRSRRDTLRWGFDFTKPLKSSPPSREQIAALARALRPARAGRAAPGATPAPAPATPGAARRPTAPRAGGGFGGGGGGGGGGRFGGRNGGRLTLSATHTLTFKDELTIAPGLPALDYLDGEALSSIGGRPRHQVEVESGYYNNGLGARLTADWRSATRVDGGTGEDLRFSGYATFDLRLFANLGERFDLVVEDPFFLGSSVRFEVKNIFNAGPRCAAATATSRSPTSPTGSSRSGAPSASASASCSCRARLFQFGGGGRRGGGGADAGAAKRLRLGGVRRGRSIRSPRAGPPRHRPTCRPGPTSRARGPCSG